MRRLLPSIVVVLVFAEVVSLEPVQAEVVVAEDFLYREKTKRFGEGGGFREQDYAGGQNGPGGRWDGRWASVGDGIVTGPDFALAQFREMGATSNGLSANFLERDYEINPSFMDQTTLYFGMKLFTTAHANQRLFISGADNPDAQLAIGLQSSAEGTGAVAVLGTSVGLAEVALEGTAHQFVAKLEINADGNQERLSVWIDPTDVEVGDIMATTTADILDGLADFTGSLRLDGGGAGRTFWDDVAIGTSWNDVVEVNVPRLTLEVNRLKGDVRFLNETDTDFDLHYYEILSPGGSLDPVLWRSLKERGVPGGMWLENNPSANRLTESNFTGSSVLGAGDLWNLGKAFVLESAEDLVASTATADGLVNLAPIEYVSFIGDPIPDFDSDGDVDSADLNQVILGWTGALGAGEGTATFSQGDVDNDGDVDTADLNIVILSWTGALAGQAQGQGGQQGAAVVPEPASGMLALLAAAALLRSRRRAVARRTQ